MSDWRLTGHDTHEFSVLRAFLLKLHGAVDGCEQGVIATNTNIGTGMKVGPALAHENVAGFHLLTTKAFHTQSFRFLIATVTSTAACLLMCHGPILY